MGEIRATKYYEKSIWLACRTCTPERWVCTICRKRKKFPELCPIRKTVLRELENTKKILPPTRP